MADYFEKHVKKEEGADQEQQPAAAAAVKPDGAWGSLVS